MQDNSISKASTLAIGDELLIGQVINTNAAWIGDYMQQRGIQLVEHRCVADAQEAIVSAIESMRRSCDLIVITGGLGSTKDDITKEVLANMVQSPLYFDDTLYAALCARLEKLKIPLLDAHRKLCTMPSKAELWSNDVGAAPGMLFRYRDCFLLSLPGVPYEMKYILEGAGSEFLQKHAPDHDFFQETILTSGIGEVALQSKIQDIIEKFPDFAFAYLPSFAHVRLRISAYGQSDMKSRAEQLTKLLLDRLADYVYGMGQQHITETIGKLLLRQSKQMAVAESCTGGLISHQITKIPGSSTYFLGGITAYANEVKKSILQVHPLTLDRYGAVSRETVTEMLLGVLKLTGADVGIATSGIAGPTGGTESKPVGTIWIAYGSADDQRTKLLHLHHRRQINNEFTAHIALNLLRRFLLE